MKILKTLIIAVGIFSTSVAYSQECEKLYPTAKNIYQIPTSIEQLKQAIAAIPVLKSNVNKLDVNSEGRITITVRFDELNPDGTKAMYDWGKQSLPRYTKKDFELTLSANEMVETLVPVLEKRISKIRCQLKGIGMVDVP